MKKCLKTAENAKNRRIHLKYRADDFDNMISVFLVPENPMVATKIFDLSPIGKKLAGPYHVLGRHLGFWALDPTMDQKCFCGAV